MKTIITLVIIFLFCSCKKTDEIPNTKQSVDSSQIDRYRHYEKITEALGLFEKQVSELYRESEENPNKVIPVIDSLLMRNKTEKDPILKVLRVR